MWCRSDSGPRVQPRCHLPRGRDGHVPNIQHERLRVVVPSHQARFADCGFSRVRTLTKDDSHPHLYCFLSVVLLLQVLCFSCKSQKPPSVLSSTVWLIARDDRRVSLRAIAAPNIVGLCLEKYPLVSGFCTEKPKIVSTESHSIHPTVGREHSIAHRQVGGNCLHSLITTEETIHIFK